jgi:DNA-binding protein HU-beta
MNQTIMVNLIAEQTGQTKEQTEATVKAALNIIRGSVTSGEPVRLPDFGTFEARRISGRAERDPQARSEIDNVRVVKFLPAEAFRKEVNDS